MLDVHRLGFARAIRLWTERIGVTASLTPSVMPWRGRTQVYGARGCQTDGLRAAWNTARIVTWSGWVWQ
jgi:hypothetical protein